MRGLSVENKMIDRQRQLYIISQKHTNVIERSEVTHTVSPTTEQTGEVLLNHNIRFISFYK